MRGNRQDKRERPDDVEYEDFVSLGKLRLILEGLKCTQRRSRAVRTQTWTRAAGG
jgi:hypothetical protein